MKEVWKIDEALDLGSTRDVVGAWRQKPPRVEVRHLDGIGWVLYVPKEFHAEWGKRSFALDKSITDACVLQSIVDLYDPAQLGGDGWDDVWDDDVAIPSIPTPPALPAETVIKWCERYGMPGSFPVFSLDDFRRRSYMLAVAFEAWLAVKHEDKKRLKQVRRGLALGLLAIDPDVPAGIAGPTNTALTCQAIPVAGPTLDEVDRPGAPSPEVLAKTKRALCAVLDGLLMQIRPTLRVYGGAVQLHRNYAEDVLSRSAYLFALAMAGGGTAMKLCKACNEPFTPNEDGASRDYCGKRRGCNSNARNQARRRAREDKEAKTDGK